MCSEKPSRETHSHLHMGAPFSLSKWATLEHHFSPLSVRDRGAGVEVRPHEQLCSGHIYTAGLEHKDWLRVTNPLLWLASL